MDSTEQKELENFIHQQLRKLPEREAPEKLMTNVLAAIAAREKQPWWRQPFTSWPRNTQVLLYGVLSIAFIAVVYFARKPAEALDVGVITERASSFAWLGRLFDTLVSSGILVLRSLSWQWFVAVAVVITVMYLACVATGFALYRITARQGASAA